jgi:hypothetical protein
MTEPHQQKKEQSLELLAPIADDGRAEQYLTQFSTDALPHLIFRGR